MKQTAVEWLIQELKKAEYLGTFCTADVFPEEEQKMLLICEQAKEMEKEQMCLFVETFEYEYFKGNVSTIDEHYDKTFNTNEK